MKGTGPVADLIAARFKAAVKRYGLDTPRAPLDVTQFRVPPDMKKQMDLFDLPSPISGEDGSRRETDRGLPDAA